MRDGVEQYDNVITLTSNAKAALDFPELDELQTYWDELRGDRPVPARSQVDPRRIGSFLDRAFILERLAPGLGRFRLAGMHLNDLMGMEVRGMPLSSFFLPEAREELAAALEHVFAGPSRVRITLAGDRGLGKPPLDAVLLLLPLAGADGQANRVLGCLATLGPVGRSPRRFRIRHVQVTAPDPASNVAPQPAWEPTTPEVATPMVSGWAEDQEPFAPPPRPRPGEKPHLYLVKSDDD